MDTSPASPVNHHADHPGFAGPKGLFIALILLMVGRTRSRLVADLASLSSSDHVVDKALRSEQPPAVARTSPEWTRRP
jgi:hypothetical protein